MTAPDTHRPVLLSEALEALAVQPEGVYIDATFGRGGHAAGILERLGPGGRLLAMDKDPQAIDAARARFGGDPRVTIVRGSFAMLEQVAQSHGVMGTAMGLLLDLGVSSPQLDDPRRGFSFQQDGPLDMRMDPESGLSAADWLAEVSESELAGVLRDLGEERFHRRVARAIVAARSADPIRTTGQLARIVAGAVRTREKHKHPATRTFQAIRIHINRELEDLQACLEQSLRVLAPGGRMAVISFHSLEDRIVKRFMRDQARGFPGLPPDLPVRATETGATLRPVGKARRPGAAESDANPRARSAVLRVAERLP